MRTGMNAGVRALCACLACATIITGAAYGDDRTPPAQQRSSDLNDLRFLITRVAKATIPAVVHIEVTQQQVVPFPEVQQSPFLFDQPDAPRKFKREIKGLGTGILIDEKGHILTNNHVVDEATDIKVVLSTGKQYTARIMGKDPKTDLAVIAITPDSKPPFVTFGDSDAVEVGEWVVAIGHPRGLDQTVTQGIISAKHRQGITEPNSYQDFLQTDAAINPGNSGGPLINLKGEVIGINSVIASESGGSEGIGFAIPSNLAVSIAQALISHGRVRRGWIGVGITDPQPSDSRDTPEAPLKGAQVTDVVKGGPAEKAGIRKGDVIVRLDGREVRDSGAMRNQVAVAAIGSTVRMSVLREGGEKDLLITIGDMDDSLKYLARTVRERLGIEVRPVKPQEADTYGIDSGVVIQWLDPKGPMAEVGFEVGDVILETDGLALQDVDDFIGVVSMLAPQQEIILLALDHRSGQSTYVQVRSR